MTAPFSPASMRPSPRMRSALLVLAVAGCNAPSPDESAALILTNAHAYTLAWGEPSRDGVPAADAPFDSASGWHHDATAVAVRHGRIVYVGTDSGALALQGSASRVIDLKGAVLLPGLVDSHTHVAELGQSLDRVNLTGIASESAAVDRIVARAKQTPKPRFMDESELRACDGVGE